jgi:hypothetical protein
MKTKHGRKVIKIIGMVFAGIAVAVLFALAFGLIVQYLWNFLMPDLFALRTITYWQAFALVILAKIFFGAFGPHHGRFHYDRRLWWKKWGYHPWNCDEMDISRENLRYYKSFWAEEGRKAFDEYVKRARDEGKQSGE